MVIQSLTTHHHIRAKVLTSSSWLIFMLNPTYERGIAAQSLISPGHRFSNPAFILFTGIAVWVEILKQSIVLVFIIVCVSPRNAYFSFEPFTQIYFFSFSRPVIEFGGLQQMLRALWIALVGSIIQNFRENVKSMSEETWSAVAIHLCELWKCVHDSFVQPWI